MTVTASDLSDRLDRLLAIDGFPDYPGALNGLQFAHRGPVERIASAVDASRRTILEAARRRANFLIVHHGLFWGGPHRVTGLQYERYRLLLENDIALYSAHLPLDAHRSIGNNVLLARELGLVSDRPFASYQGTAIGLSGPADLPTESLVAAATSLAERNGGAARVSAFEHGRLTRRWAICTGAGASSETLAEAETSGIDTLIVGEGPHHTAVEAPERGLVVIYAGHYATETLGVRALAEWAAQECGLPWDFVSAPTGF